ncbi:DUF4430 domain-containing protein [Oceanobacillus kapialis]|uniref:DUF4430 domain-containing protein n=1 Tax=Oceanobacillus kapialis TaxID=481353 RepID=UPI00384DB313
MNNRMVKYAAFLFSLLLIIGNITFMQPLSVHAANLDDAITIKAIGENGEAVIPLTAIELEEGDTAFDVLLDAGEAHGQEIQYEEYDFGNMITSIGEVPQTDSHAWSFNVNGKAADVGASSYEVEHGDNLLFAVRDLENFSPEVSVKVSAQDGNDNAIMKEEEVSIAAGASAYDALYQAALQEGLSIDLSIDDTYFTFINNIGETELGPNDYWNVTVDNEAISTSVAAQTIQAGQEVNLKLSTYVPPEEEEEEAPNDETPTEDTEEETEAPVDEAPAAVTKEQVQPNVNDVLSYMDNANITLNYGSEWWVWGVAHTSRAIPDHYVESIEALLDENKGEFRSVFELEKVMIGLSAAGKDASSIHGYNLIDKLITHSWMEDPAINAAIYGLLAIDSTDYKGSADFRANLVQSILDKELNDGGWTYFGSEPSPDITGMALAALAPYQDDPEVKAAIERAVTYLSEGQDAAGGYDIAFNGGDSSESVSQAIIGLTAVGVDPTSSPFTKEGGNLLQHLLKFKQADGGFSHLMDEASGGMSTQQALLALVAYQKLLDGSGSVYQFATPSEEVDPPTTPEEPETPEDQEKPENPEDEENNPTQPEKEEPKEQNPPKEQDPNEENAPKNEQSNNKTKQENQLKQSANTSEHASGKKLPETSTDTFNFLAGGLALFGIGVILYLIWRKRLAKESM